MEVKLKLELKLDVQNWKQFNNFSASKPLTQRMWLIYFAISSSSAWNSLPVNLRDPGLSLMTSRPRLKTYLFNPPGYLIFILSAAQAI